jgi:hypothetical protein
MWADGVEINPENRTGTEAGATAERWAIRRPNQCLSRRSTYLEFKKTEPGRDDSGQLRTPVRTARLRARL